jgi:polar amino acid transport system substrate-binding protein
MAIVFSSRRGRSPLLALAVGTVTIAMTLVGCGGSDGPVEAAADEANFDQSLHDLLPDRVKDSGTISFGGLWETPPVLSVNEADPTTPMGLAPDLAERFGAILGVDVEWQNLAWPAQIPGLQSGSVDVLFGQVSITEEREQSVLDLIPFQSRGHGLLVAAGNPEDINDLADLCGLTVGVPLGSNQSAKVSEVSEQSCVGAGKPAVKQAEYQGAAAAVQALRAGTINAWLDVYPNIYSTAQADPDVFDGIEVPEKEMPIEYSGLAVSKDDPGLSKALLGAMKILIEDGSYAEIYEARDQGPAMVSLDDLTINPMTGTPAGEMAAK